MKQKQKGLILGLLLVSLIYLSTSPLIADSNADISTFELSHFPKTAINENPSVAMQIRIIAKEHNFEWSDYLVNLAYCESRLNPLAYNAKGNYPVGSLDRGLFEINDYWHKEVSSECAFDIRCSTEWTMEMINAGRQSMWVCDDYI